VEWIPQAFSQPGPWAACGQEGRGRAKHGAQPWPASTAGESVMRFIAGLPEQA
jgi:hypothetical protein